MGTRSEVSKKNRYWIEKHRYYELKHFCLQYPIWKEAYTSLDGYAKTCELPKSKYGTSDPTSKCVIAKEAFRERMEIVEKAIINTDESLYNYLLIGVTEGLSYDILKVRYNIPCCKDVYYELYRKFFWTLSKIRN